MSGKDFTLESDGIEIVEGEVVEANEEEAIESEWTPRDADREERKSYTRQRVRNSTVPEGTIFIPAKPKPSISDKSEKRVAVYARVSTKSEDQVSSIENQTKYYTEKVEKTPNWDLQGIYADEGKTGTSMRKREEFKRMLEVAANKEIDLIICASVSRFARNMTDCMEQISLLRTKNPNHPVGVYFETENLYTLDPDCEQALAIHAMLADWESNNKSRRMILSYDQRICTGQFPVSDLLGYRHTKDGDLVIQKDEALTVRFAFLARIIGYSYEDIAEIFTQKERKSLNGRTEWNEGMVSNLLTNERRWGDLKVRKTIVVDYKKGITKKNDGDREAAFVPNHHEAIVSPEIAKAAQMVTSKVDGVPEIRVIEEGGLKGFINLNPCFKGIDLDALHRISSCVYEREEFAQIAHEANILTGKEHAKVLSKDFTGYFVPNSAYFISQNTPTLTISTTHLKFNKKCFEKFFDTEYIEFLYHPLLQAIIIKCTEDDEMGIPWIKEDGGFISSYSAASFCNAVYEEMDWIKDYDFRFRGITRQKGFEKIMIFYLDEPQVVPNKKVKEAAAALSEEQKLMPSRYIPIRNSELESNSLYREGMIYALRKRRDLLISSLSEEDINEPGILVDNPFIGELPTRDEIAMELNEILQAM